MRLNIVDDDAPSLEHRSDGPVHLNIVDDNASHAAAPSAAPERGFFETLASPITGGLIGKFVHPTTEFKKQVVKESEPSLANFAKQSLLGPAGALMTSPIATTPLLDFTELTPEPGVSKGVAGVVSGLTSPASIALLWGAGGLGTIGKGLVSKLASAGFALDTFKSVAEKFPHLRKAIKDLDSSDETTKNNAHGEVAQTITEMGLGSLLGALSLRHSLTSEPAPVTGVKSKATATPSPKVKSFAEQMTEAKNSKPPSWSERALPAVKKWWELSSKSGESILRDRGPAGEEMANSLRSKEYRASVLAGSLKEKWYEITKGFTKEQHDQLARASRGDDVPTLDPAVRAALPKVRAVLNEVLHRAQAAGVQQHLPDGSIVPLRGRQNYWPMFFSEEVENILKARKETAPQGSLSIGERVVGSIQRIRREPGLEEWARTDPNVIPEYIDEAARKIAEVEVLGNIPKGGVLPIRVEGLLDSMEDQRPGSSLAARYVANLMLNKNPALDGGIARNAMAAIMDAEGALRLSHVSVRHLSQPGYGMAAGGVGRWMRALGETIKGPKAAEEFAQRSGSIGDIIQKEWNAMEGGTNRRLTGWLMDIQGMTAERKWFAVVNAASGRLYAREMLARLIQKPGDTFLRSEYQKYTGLDPEAMIRQGSLTEENELMAANAFVRRTMFGSSVLDLPPSWVGTTTGKVMSQFRGWGFNATKFIKDQIVNAAHGHPAGLITLFGTSQIAGEATGDIMALITGHKRPKKFTERLADNLAMGGMLGLFDRFVTDLTTPTRFGQSAASAPPLIGEAVRVGSILSGPNKTLNTAKYAAGMAPVVGPTLSRAIGDWANPKAAKTRNTRNAIDDYEEAVEAKDDKKAAEVLAKAAKGGISPKSIVDGYRRRIMAKIKKEDQENRDQKELAPESPPQAIVGEPTHLNIVD